VKSVSKMKSMMALGPGIRNVKDDFDRSTFYDILDDKDTE